MTAPASKPTLYGVEFVQVTDRVVCWLIVDASTPVVPNASGLAAIVQFAWIVSVTLNWAVALPFE